MRGGEKRDNRNGMGGDRDKGGKGTSG